MILAEWREEALDVRGEHLRSRGELAFPASTFRPLFTVSSFPERVVMVDG
jgi:hypothetical protein